MVIPTLTHLTDQLLSKNKSQKYVLAIHCHPNQALIFLTKLDNPRDIEPIHYMCQQFIKKLKNIMQQRTWMFMEPEYNIKNPLWVYIMFLAQVNNTIVSNNCLIQFMNGIFLIEIR